MAIYSMVKNNTFNGMNLPSIVLKQGDKLMEIDFAMVEAAGCPIATPLVITSQNQFEIINLGTCSLNQDIIKLD